MAATSDESESLLLRLREGDPDALADEFSRHRERLRRMVAFRMDRRLLGRIDAEDVLQEAYLGAAQRIRHYINKPSTSLFIWLRQIVTQTLIDIHRRHLGAKKRNAGREISIDQRYHPATSVSLAGGLAGSLTSPSGVAMKQERMRQLEAALETMAPIDQEVIALRHFEELTNSEVAEVLDLNQKTASIRYVRAVRRLKEVLENFPGFKDAGND
ncbi:MAG: sigma-70 family RNA polymerase sigma factor [Planctomycetota bacterium]|nr:sigma-70 family RNA polymerase sigma factor [Planctomycetota bacterium]